jgi:hypothetical protein
MQEIIKRAECYIKDEESNAKKRTRDAREMDPTDRGPYLSNYDCPTLKKPTQSHDALIVTNDEPRSYKTALTLLT